MKYFAGLVNQPVSLPLGWSVNPPPNQPQHGFFHYRALKRLDGGGQVRNTVSHE